MHKTTTKPQNPPCPECKAKQTVKKGRRQNRLRTLQLYQCVECLHRFTGEAGKHKTIRQSVGWFDPRESIATTPSRWLVSTSTNPLGRTACASVFRMARSSCYGVDSQVPSFRSVSPPGCQMARTAARSGARRLDCQTGESVLCFVDWGNLFFSGNLFSFFKSAEIRKWVSVN